MRFKMPNVGMFQNRDIMLEWVGRSRRNGQDCALIKYQAFFNPVEIANGGMTLKGRSDYWGEFGCRSPPSRSNTGHSMRTYRER